MAVLLVLTGFGAAVIGGVFFGFSSFIMKALAHLPPAHGVAAMQRINVIVINPGFLGVFIGTAILAVACCVAAFTPWSGTRSMAMLCAGLAYALGCFGVTMRCNVPRNDRLARLASSSPEARAYWPVYVREWLAWNHVRTIAALAAAGFAALALAY